MKKRIITKKAGITYLQIIIMIVSIFSFSYILYSVESIDAAQYGDVCCEKTLSGETCQMEPGSNCDSSFRVSPTSCENTDYCKVGCCVSEQTGLCNRMASKRDCNGTFIQDPMCNNQDCRKGCCFFEDDVAWTTEKNCKFIGNSENNEVKTNWLLDENHDTELECLFSLEKGIEGACVYDDDNERKCLFTTLEDCVERTGDESNFDREGRFCSDPELNTTCKAKDHKGCVEGEEDVYWFDSCDNKEDIAEDCDLYSGSYCGKKDDKYFCKNVDCNDIGRKNGESWCEYDGTIGNGKDPVGSRHIRHVCYMGEERIDPCSDYRNEICVEETTNTKKGEFSQASCRVNQWRTCLDLNRYEGSEKMVSRCEKNPDCWVKEIDMSGSFNFKVCLPEYPPGFSFPKYQYENMSEQAVQESYYVTSSAEGICSAATMECKTTWRCCLLTGCICIDNCDCHTQKFTREMNEFCTSLGDCGGYVNYVGTYTDGGYSVRADKAPPGRIGNIYSQYAEPKPNQDPADPGNAEFLESFAPELMQKIPSGNGKNVTAFERELLNVAGSLGSPLLLGMLSQNEDEEITLVSNLKPNAVNFAMFSNGAGTTKSGINAQIIYEDKQIPDMSSLVAMIAGMIAGIVAYAITQSLMAVMIAAFLAAMIAMLFAICWIEYHYVYFNCHPWEAPSGNADCEECNQLESPCTEYRCNSLGEQCQFINKGTGKELCVGRPVDKSYPKIQPLESAIAEGYEYYNVNENGFEIVKSEDKGCIEAFTTVEMGIKVSPFARCKLGTEASQTYQEMNNPFGPRGNMILPIHLLGLYFPSPDAFKNQYNLTQKQINELGQMEYYVKCKTASGMINPETYTIKTCIDPGPDVTPPRITITNPRNNHPVKYNQKTLDLGLYVNEPAECKWSFEDKVYDEMENELKCNSDLGAITTFGFACNTTLNNIQNQSEFYFRCKDQPWLGDSLDRNVMIESFKFKLKKSKKELIIEEILPRDGDVLVEAYEPISLDLKVLTSGGVNNGRADCWWDGNGYSDKFTKTNDSQHEYNLASAMRGDYNIKIRCEDEAGNIANETTSFEIKVDNFGPKIIRIYYDGSLKIITNEKGECRYSFDNSNFENSTSMGSFGNEHFAEWQLRDYYIQCQDENKNKGGKIKIKGYELLS